MLHMRRLTQLWKKRSPLEQPRFLFFGLSEQILFVRRLSVYLSAGIPILEALSLLRDSARTKSSLYIMQSLVLAVSEGRSLSMGLRAFPGAMRPVGIAMIEIGEESGTLPRSLAQLAEALKKQTDLQRQLVGALIYPGIIVFSTLAISAFLSLYAFPKIVPLFRGFGTDLPLSTRILIFISDSVARYGWVLLLLCILTAACGWYLLKKPLVRLACDTFVLRIPLLGALVRTYLLARLSRILSTLLHSGSGIIRALELSEAVSVHGVYGARLKIAKGGVLSGERLSVSLKGAEQCFPTLYMHMIETGERTGTLPSALTILSEYYEEEFDAACARLATLIEPLLMIIMGLLVGFIALAIITPVYQITQGLHG